MVNDWGCLAWGFGAKSNWAAGLFGMQVDKVRRLAASILSIGENRVWLDPEQTGKIEECMTKEDVRAIIKDGTIRKRKMQMHSRGRARMLHAKKKLGRKRGMGKRRGKFKARVKKKMMWVRSVRAQRKKISEMRKKGVKLKIPYGKIYRMIKGGYFRGKKHLETVAAGGKP